MQAHTLCTSSSNCSMTASRRQPVLAHHRLPAVHCCAHQDPLATASDTPDHQAAQQHRTHRRALLCTLVGLSAAGAVGQSHAEIYDVASTQEADTTITHQVYLDIAIAPRSFKRAGERTLGDKTVIPLEEAVPTGRIVLGLYGNVAPNTVSNFLKLVRSGALEGTVFSKVLPGEYIQAGQQGAYRMGQVEAEKAELQGNPDLSSSAAFVLRHLRPGTLSLSLTENDEDPLLRQAPGYHNAEFLITTGPGPVPRLDSGNLVFGRVVEGMSVVSTIAQVPTFKPSERSKQLNIFAQTIGDDRAANVRRKYGKPLKAVIIMSAGELPVPVASPVAPTTAAL